MRRKYFLKQKSDFGCFKGSRLHEQKFPAGISFLSFERVRFQVTCIIRLRFHRYLNVNFSDFLGINNFLMKYNSYFN